MNRVPRLLWALVVVGTLGYVAQTLWLSWRAIFFPFTLDYGEGVVVWFMRKLALGQSIYPPPLVPPLDASNYPPVAMLLAATQYPLFGDSLIFGRWLSFAAALIISAFIIRLVRGETNNLRVGLLAGALFFGSTFLYHWVPLFRVDLIGVAFTFAGIYCVWRWQSASARPRRELIFALVFFLLAIYTKHSLFFAPIAAIIAIFLRDRRAAYYFALAFAVIGGVIFAALEIVTAGAWSFSIVSLNATVWTPRVFVPLVSSFITTYLVLLGFGGFGWFGRVRARSWGVLEIYAAIAFFGIALAGREGAWENYFLEQIALICIFAGIGIARLLKTQRGAWLVPLALLVQLALFWNDHDPRIAQQLFDDVRASHEELSALVQNMVGTVIAEDTGLLWSNGKPVAYYSFPYSTLARAGRYDQRWELDNLRAGTFPLVVLNHGTREDIDHFGNFTHAFISALDYGYAESHANALYNAYAPAPLQHLEPTARFGDLFELVGWSLEPDTLSGGQELVLSTVWRALKTPSTRYTLFAHLETADGAKLAQQDHEPLNGAFPTTRWIQDDMVRITSHLPLPTRIPPNKYILRLGWYDTATQDRLNLNTGGDTLGLTSFPVP